MFNLSDRILTPIEQALNMVLKQKKLSTFEIIARFEQLVESLNDLKINVSNLILYTPNFGHIFNFFNSVSKWKKVTNCAWNFECYVKFSNR